MSLYVTIAERLFVIWLTRTKDKYLLTSMASSGKQHCYHFLLSFFALLISHFMSQLMNMIVISLTRTIDKYILILIQSSCHRSQAIQTIDYLDAVLSQLLFMAISRVDARMFFWYPSNFSTKPVTSPMFSRRPHTKRCSKEYARTRTKIQSSDTELRMLKIYIPKYKILS